MSYQPEQRIQLADQEWFFTYPRGDHIQKSLLDTHFIRIADKRGYNLSDKLSDMISGNHLVELGPNSTPLEYMWEFNPAKITLVEPSSNKPVSINPLVEIVDEHALEFLKKQTGELAIISSALFCPVILSEQYARKLVEEIKRTTHRYTLHGTQSDYHNLFLEQGFKPVVVMGGPQIYNPNEINLAAEESPFVLALYEK